MDYKDKLKLAKEALDSGSYDKETIEYIFPELKESGEDKNKRISKEITQFLKQNNGWNREWLTWLENQGNKTKEYIFRPIAGCTIDKAARQAIYKVANGENIVFSFNGFYMKIYKDTTIDNIINSYNDFCKKQGKSKWSEEDEENLRDIIGAIHSVAYQTTEAEAARINWIKSLKQRIEEL